MSQALQYSMPATVPYPFLRKEAKKATRKAQARALTTEDYALVTALEAVKNDIAYLHNCFDQITDDVLIDALIFELKAAGLKYKYFHNLLKEKGIIHGEVPASLLQELPVFNKGQAT